MTDMIAIMLCSCICWRVINYRRGNARYRLLISIAAYLLAMGSGCYALSLALGVAGQTSPFVVLMLALLAALVWRANGNVARVLRVHWPDELGSK